MIHACDKAHHYCMTVLLESESIWVKGCTDHSFDDADLRIKNIVGGDSYNMLTQVRQTWFATFSRSHEEKYYW